MGPDGLVVRDVGLPKSGISTGVIAGIVVAVVAVLAAVGAAVWWFRFARRTDGHIRIDESKEEVESQFTP